MEIISESSTVEYNRKYAVTYKDKELDLEEYCERGENTITYNFHSLKGNKIVEQKLDPDQNSSQFTVAYFKYINTYGTIPTFKLSPESNHGFAFKMIDENGEDYVMKFVAEVAGHKDTYCLNLEEFGVYIFDKEVLEKDPYTMEMDILLEIYFTEDRTKLLIVDYDQHEFYGIDVHYKRILSGKLSKTYADISSYIQDGEKYDFIYDKKGELSEIKTFSGDVVSYIEKSDNMCNATYRIPYAKTSYGVIISDQDHVLYESRYRNTEEGEQDIDTTIRLLTKEESENFLNYVEKI